MKPSDATAAYNFIGLPDAILPAELDAYRADLLSGDEARRRAAMQRFLAEKGKLSGAILLDIEALTPLYIGTAPETARHFSLAGHPILPGSSIRGMVKNLAKIITCGSLHGDEDIYDRHLYYRCLMAPRSAPRWMGALNKAYRARMSGTKTVIGKDGRKSQKPMKKARTGFLVRMQDDSCYVYPLLAGHEAKRVLITEYQDLTKEEIGDRESRVSWREEVAYIITGSQRADRLVRTWDEYRRICKTNPHRVGKQFVRSVSLRDGDWNEGHRILVPPEVAESYVKDTSRQGVNLFDRDSYLEAEEARALGAKLPATAASVVPCGYLEEKGRISAFGHGLDFRIPYKSSILDAVPQVLQEDTIDFVTAMFGSKELWAGRVFFEDAEPVGEVTALAAAPAHPLLSPNPTSYQLYLKQERGRDLRHWDTPNAQIRGYKLYWHRKTADWKATAEEKKNKNVVRTIAPLAQGSRFCGKIRFEHLTPLELGALLMVFDMEGAGANLAYKLGAGKAMGLGSVKIIPHLLLEREDCYETLFSADGQFAPAEQEAGTQPYLDAFAHYVENSKLARSWQDIMRETVEMLDWDKAEQEPGWSARVKSMSGNVQSGEVDARFVNRAVLPTVDEVYKG